MPQPRTRFRPNLRPLPATDFEIVSYTSLKVSTNCCIYLGRDQHISQKVHVAYSH